MGGVLGQIANGIGARALNTITVQSGQSIQSAITAASSGTTIVVYPGTYNESIMLKNGVNMYFMPGAIVDYSGASALPVIYDEYFNGTINVGGAVTCIVGGFGQFKQSGTHNGGSADKAVLCAKNASSSITFECKSLWNNHAASGSNQSGLLVGAAQLKLMVHDFIRSTPYDGVISLDTGVAHIDSPVIDGVADDGIEISAGALYVNCNTISGASGNAVNAIGGNTYIKYFTVTGVFLEDGGNIFVTAPTAVP